MVTWTDRGKKVAQVLLGWKLLTSHHHLISFHFILFYLMSLNSVHIVILLAPNSQDEDIAQAYGDTR